VVTSSKALVSEKVLEDPLFWLPCSTIQVFRKDETIYSPDLPSRNLCLVIDGKVKICRTAETGSHTVLVDIYHADEFFGESALIGALSTESAIALEDTQLMTWRAEEIELLSLERPKLAVALMQLLVQRAGDLERRIESFALDSIQRRLARALIRFAERLGSPAENGMVQMIPFTHELLSQYVGTSREIITQYMNQFRQQRYVLYSRQGIALNADALQSWLDQRIRSAGEPVRQFRADESYEPSEPMSVKNALSGKSGLRAVAGSRAIA
jgi:CRP-like cAMP-binding protein